MAMRYGKTAQNAIAVMSLLAQHYGQNKRFTSIEIAQTRNLSKPLVAKLLTTLSMVGFIDGTPGRNGGYALVKPPEEITLEDIVVLFEQTESEHLQCPYGPGWCGNKPQCPLHNQLDKMRNDFQRFLSETTLDVFEPAETSNPLKLL